MKYIRNSNRKTPAKKPKLTDEQKLTLEKQRIVSKHLSDDIKWVEELSALDQFSSEWTHKVLLELLLQCMGKKEVIQGFCGNELVLRVFKEKPALDIVGMIAKMNGHLFDVVKGTLNKTVEGQIEHKHQVELLPDSNRTDSVLDILNICGGLNQRTKRLTKDDVEVISA